jgi:hypothetical protein
MTSPNVKEVVRERYGRAALRVRSGAGDSCRGNGSSALEGFCDPITSNFYEGQEDEVPGMEGKGVASIHHHTPSEGRISRGQHMSPHKRPTVVKERYSVIGCS